MTNTGGCTELLTCQAFKMDFCLPLAQKWICCVSITDGWCDSCISELEIRLALGGM